MRPRTEFFTFVWKLLEIDRNTLIARSMKVAPAERFLEFA